MKARKPFVLLDVDGVINVWPRPTSTDGHKHVTVNGYSIWYNTAVIDRINALADRAELRWLTTWRALAPTMLAPAVGLIDFRIVPDDGSIRSRLPYPLDWWKLAAADALIRDDDRPVVWCDDDMEPELRKEIERRYGAERLLLITPTSVPGLTLDHLDQIDTFVDAAIEAQA